MTIHRSQATEAKACMNGDFVRVVSPYGASYPASGVLGPAVTQIASGIFGKIVVENGEHFLVPDERTPGLMRALGNLRLGQGVTVERISVEHEYEKAILGLQYLQKISDVARARATEENGQVKREVLQALLGPAATTDLQRIVDELEAAGMSFVEKVSTKTIQKRTMVLTANPEAVRNGTTPIDAMTFDSPATETTTNNIEVYDPSRTRELLLSTQPVREVAPQPGEAAQPDGPELGLMRLLGLDGALSAEDVELGAEDDEHGERPAA